MSLRDRVLDFETVTTVRLAELAGEHSVAGTFEANGGKITALQRQKGANLKVGDVAEAHRNVLQDRRHRQPRLLNAGLHEPGPAPIGRQRLGLGIVRQFGAEGQKKRLRQ